ncbi:arginine and glutamate-rich protein 1-A [Silurus meridionalis]|nr:arginine and glutamate-rich protein 1-A [Silurus meridionalis]
MGRSRSRSSSRSKHTKSGSKHSKKRGSRSRSHSRDRERSSKKRSRSREAKRNRRRESRSQSRSNRERARAASPVDRVDMFGRTLSKRTAAEEKQRKEEEEKKAEMERQRKIRQQEIEERLIEEETARRVEELVARRVEEELEKRRDEIEREVLRRVEEAKRIMEAQLLQELERQRQAELSAQKAREVTLGRLERPCHPLLWGNPARTNSKQGGEGEGEPENRVITHRFLSCAVVNTIFNSKSPTSRDHTRVHNTEEEKSKREELEKILEENNRKIAEAQAKLNRPISGVCGRGRLVCSSAKYWESQKRRGFEQIGAVRRVRSELNPHILSGPSRGF